MSAPILLDATMRDDFFRQPPFDELSVGEQDTLAKKAKLSPFVSDEILYAQGEQVRHIAVVCAGQVKLSSTAAQGRECVLHIIRPYSAVDLGVLFYEDGIPYSATALTDGMLCRIETTIFLQFFTKNAAFALRSMRILTARQRLFINKLVASQGRISVVCRVSSWLLHRSRMSQSDVLHFDIGRELMARLLGVTRESLSRELSRLAELGYIAVDKRCICLLDKDALTRLARM